MKQGRKFLFTPEKRISIILEYLHGDQSMAAIAQKYGIRSQGTLSKWVNSLQMSEKSSNFAPTIKSTTDMTDPERRELMQQIVDLEQRLKKSELQNYALNTLIDIAEEQGIQIRKKSGAKQ